MLDRANCDQFPPSPPSEHYGRKYHLKLESGTIAKQEVLSLEL
jgi:hypothetical protein